MGFGLTRAEGGMEGKTERVSVCVREREREIDKNRNVVRARPLVVFYPW